MWKKHCCHFTSNKNAIIKRLAYILAHYQLWIKKAAKKTKSKGNEITCVQELMDLLENYNRPSMMDDYYAIKAMIEMEEKNNNNPETKEQKSNDINNNNNLKMLEIREYFQSILGQCTNFSNCQSFVRNRRSRSSDNITNERRAAFHIRNEDIEKYENNGCSRFEVKEVILQSSLDVIHNYIFHAKDEEMNVNKSHSNKFVTEVGMEENNSNNKQTRVKKMGQYSFGVNTNYWLRSHPCFVHTKYPDLKTELTSNSLHSISLLEYEIMEEQASDILKTKYGQSLKSKREFEWMEVNGQQLIPMGSLITEKHLISVLAYTNHNKMQNEFKKHGFRKLREEETERDVRRRNSEIAHWSRVVWEVIQCWGSVMNRKKPFFHGIDCKLLFEHFSYIFCMPTSLTTNVRIAKNFAKDDGIILVLKHAQETDIQSLMFDVSLISDFPNEEECLIFRTKAQFYDILMDGKSLKHWMKVLRMYERLIMGGFLSHISFSETQQELIVNMMDNYLEDKKKNVEFYENGNVPKYIQLLFNECTGDHWFFVNSYEIKRAITNETLLQYLDGSQNGKNSKFLSVFDTVREVHVYEWLVTGDSYVSYFADSHPWVVDHHSYRINLANKSEDEPMFLVFHWEIKNWESSGLLTCFLTCDHLPEEVEEVEMNLGLFVEETQSEATSGSFVNHQQLCGDQLRSIVESKQLLMENNSDIKRDEFNIKVCFSLTSCQLF